jgi:tetratricopeptide (TPR) repeat protein
MFWPFNYAFAPISSDIHVAAGIISVALLSLAIVLSERRDWKLIIFGVLWFLAFLVPTFYYYSGVHTPPKFYEHRIYLPFMGILFVLLSLSYTNKLRYINRYSSLILFLVIISSGWLSYTRTFNFKNSLALGEYDASTSPSDPRRYADITRMAIPEKLDQEMNAVQGRLQLRKSKRDPVSNEELWKIIDNLRSEIKSNRNDPELYHALAVASFARGFFLSSEEYFLTARQEKPQDATIPYNLGILYYIAQPKMKAEKEWLEALRLEPTMGNAHLNLSYYYYESGQYRSAWDHCQKAIQLGIAVPSNLVNEIRGKIS